MDDMLNTWPLYHVCLRWCESNSDIQGVLQYCPYLKMADKSQRSKFFTEMWGLPGAWPEWQGVTLGHHEAPPPSTLWNVTCLNVNTRCTVSRCNMWHVVLIRSGRLELHTGQHLPNRNTSHLRKLQRNQVQSTPRGPPTFLLLVICAMRRECVFHSLNKCVYFTVGNVWVI